MELKRAFGAQVRHHRRAKGLTQEGLAQAVGVTQETIGKVERGVTPPSFDTAEAIARALDIPAVALFGAGEEATPPGERGQLLARIQAALAGMNDGQLRRAANILDAFMGR